jgi:hypothetical protein
VVVSAAGISVSAAEVESVAIAVSVVASEVGVSVPWVKEYTSEIAGSLAVVVDCVPDAELLASCDVMEGKSLKAVLLLSSNKTIVSHPPRLMLPVLWAPRFFRARVTKQAVSSRFDGLLAKIVKVSCPMPGRTSGQLSRARSRSETSRL